MAKVYLHIVQGEAGQHQNVVVWNVLSIKTKQNNYDICMSTPLGIIFVILRGYTHSLSMKLFQRPNRNGRINAEHAERGWNNIQIIPRGYLHGPPHKLSHMREILDC